MVAGAVCAARRCVTAGALPCVTALCAPRRLYVEEPRSADIGAEPRRVCPALCRLPSCPGGPEPRLDCASVPRRGGECTTSRRVHDIRAWRPRALDESPCIRARGVAGPRSRCCALRRVARCRPARRSAGASTGRAAAPRRVGECTTSRRVHGIRAWRCRALGGSPRIRARARGAAGCGAGEVERGRRAERGVRERRGRGVLPGVRLRPSGRRVYDIPPSARRPCVAMPCTRREPVRWARAWQLVR